MIDVILFSATYMAGCQDSWLYCRSDSDTSFSKPYLPCKVSSSTNHCHWHSDRNPSSVPVSLTDSCHATLANWLQHIKDISSCSCIHWAIKLSMWCFLSFTTAVCSSGVKLSDWPVLPPAGSEFHLLCLSAEQDVRQCEPVLSDGSRGHCLLPGMNEPCPACTHFSLSEECLLFIGNSFVTISIL